jgi:hypothetical protein
MGWLSSAVECVTKVADYATGGKIGEIISNALEKLGLPKEICNVFAMIGDPSYSTKAICEEIDRVGKALGLPEQLTGALKKLVHKAEEYTQAFFQGGFGAVICAVGKDLGLPPALYEGIAAAVDAYTGNEAGAAAHLAKFALECARFLGVPESSLHLLKLATDVVNRDGKAVVGDGFQLAADVADHLDIAPEFKDLIHAGADAYASTLDGGDKKAFAGDLAKLAGHLGERMGLPEEFSSGLKLGAAYLTGDNAGMKAAGKELCHEMIGHLDASPEVKMMLNMATDQAVDHGGEIKDALKKVPDLVKNATPKVKAQVEAIQAFIEGLASSKSDDGSSDIDWKNLGGKLLDSIKSGTVKVLQSTRQEAIKGLEDKKATASPEEKVAIQFAIDVLNGDRDALKADLKTVESALESDPDIQRLVMMILGGNAQGAKDVVEPQQDKDGNKGASAEIRQADRFVQHFIRA